VLTQAGPQTLRRWLLAEGLGLQRRRDPHRRRRPRRACFGELVQMDASEHDRLEDCGEDMVLITMMDDATNYLLARFYPAGTTEPHTPLADRESAGNRCLTGEPSPPRLFWWGPEASAAKC
jgi:hypothetical protein